MTTANVLSNMLQLIIIINVTSHVDAWPGWPQQPITDTVTGQVLS